MPTGEIMPNYNEWEKRADHGAGFRKKSFGGRDNRSGGFGGGRDRFDKPKFQAVCVECGERCEVPFRPVQGKPVFCDNCFRREDRGGDRGGDRGFRDDRGPKRFDRPERGGDASRTEFEQLNRKLDAIMELLKNVKSQNATVHVVKPQVTEESQVEATVQTEEAKPSKKKSAKKSEDKPEKAEKKAAKKAKK